LAFVLLIAFATALGVAITSQEEAVREGSARAADTFDLLVAAPGSQTDVVMAAIYLQPGTVPLLEGALVAQALGEPRAVFSAPLGFGDNIHGSPVVGSTAAFVEHLSKGLAEGRSFATQTEAVVGAASKMKVGDAFAPIHGTATDGEDNDSDHASEHVHPQRLTVVGRMKQTGTPWDNAVVVPIEYIWQAHGLPTGHAREDTRIGPPFDLSRTPGSPVIVMKPRTVADAYRLRMQYRTNASMAFFPAEALLRLYDVLANVRVAMTWLALAAQALVVLSMLAGIMAILAVHRRQFAVLRALGAPRAYIFLSVWMSVSVLVVSGAVLGLAAGTLTAMAGSALLAHQTGIALSATLGWGEVALVLGMIGFGLLVAVIPALIAYRHPVITSLQST
jgi:putative ABC transport system permease protein